MRFLITGTAGFIGFHLARRLLAEDHVVHGVDGLTPYYDQALKRRRNEILEEFSGFSATQLMLEDAAQLNKCVAEVAPDVVVHLAAQAGVRYSLENPRGYLDSNMVGTFNLLEAVSKRSCQHLVMASTSSVYGANRRQPFEETHVTDQPVSLYAATKKATEVLAFAYSRNCALPITMTRLFTVYGPWGRPDMAIFKFTRNIIEGRPIDVYASGRMTRDFTYVDDVVEALRRLINLPPAVETQTPFAKGDAQDVPYRVVNIGCGNPVGLDDFIRIIEEAVGRKAVRNNLPMQPGDVPSTWASTALLQQLTGFKPETTLAQGVRSFVAWYRDYHRL